MVPHTVCAYLIPFLGCAGGGLGGGEVNVPVFLLILGFPMTYAVPLSMMTILGVSFANVVLYALSAHPTVPHRPMIGMSLIGRLID